MIAVGVDEVHDPRAGLDSGRECRLDQERDLQVVSFRGVEDERNGPVLTLGRTPPGRHDDVDAGAGDLGHLAVDRRRIHAAVQTRFGPEVGADVVGGQRHLAVGAFEPSSTGWDQWPYEPSVAGLAYHG